MFCKKRLISALLAATFSVGTFSTAYAANTNNNIVPALNTTDHIPFMNGMSDGFFYPNQELTRGQLAYILYSLLSEQPEYICTFTDVQPDLWYAKAIGTLEGLGVLDTPAGGQFRPNDPVTRGEASLMISAFLPKENNNNTINPDNTITDDIIGENTDKEDSNNENTVENTDKEDGSDENTVENTDKEDSNNENTVENTDKEDGSNENTVENTDKEDSNGENTIDNSIDIPFSDVSIDNPAVQAIIDLTSAGIFTGYEDGTFKPNNYMIRSEAVTVINKLLKRVPDTTTISTSNQVRFFPDVPVTHWAYNQIMEATVPHTYIKNIDGSEHWQSVTSVPTGLNDGIYTINGELYCIINGNFARNTWKDGFYFGVDGQYTCGDESLDEKIKWIVNVNTDASMTQEQKLRKLFDYCRDNFSYLKRPYVYPDQTNWEIDYANDFLTLKKGNCHSFAALFYLLARQIGYPAYTVEGKVGTNAMHHGWVQIPIDGVHYLFDPELAWSYLYQYGNTKYNFFKMDPSNPTFIYRTY